MDISESTKAQAEREIEDEIKHLQLFAGYFQSFLPREQRIIDKLIEERECSGRNKENANVKLTEQSTVAEHLQSLAESEPEKFKMGGLTKTILMMREADADGWSRIGFVHELTQDDWDSILKEIGRRFLLSWDNHTKTLFAKTYDLNWQKELLAFDTHESEKSPSAAVAGCAAIREHLEGKP